MVGEYISREAAIASLCCDCSATGDCRPGERCVDYQRLKDIPSADVVEVVRCRECENWDTEWKPNHAEEGQYFCPILGQVTDTDFYCGCGKRKDGGQDE